MKVSHRWLLDYVDCPWEPAELADRLTMGGLKVESLERQGPALAGVIVARVESVARHPEADNLYIAQLDTGPSRATVVTGADNVKQGDLVPYAPPGTQLPNGQRLEAVRLRGVLSEGMMCSEAELGVGDDADGIMVLPPDAVVGRPVDETLGLDDWVYELEVYPNRPDCQGVIGIAREVAALCGAPLRLPPGDYPEEGPEAAGAVRVDIEDEDLCRRYLAHLADGVAVGPSPLWLQQRLRVAGMRPISNVVDITNFVMWEWGQPLHAFDFPTLQEARIVVRRARPGEAILTLDGKERKLEPDMLVIADGKRPVAVAGVMGGAETEVVDGTTHVLLEAAHFEAVSVRRTSRRLGLRTEASHRFEKGLDPELPLAAARRALHLMHRLAGARIYRGRVDAYPRPVAPRTVVLRPERVNRFLGLDLDAGYMADTLRRLGFGVRPRAGEGESAPTVLEVEVPTFRQDVEREVDLAEEIVRLYGFDRVPARLPQAAAEAGGQSLQLRALDTVRHVLVGMGFSEAINYSFVSPRHGDALLLPADHPWRRHVELRNPLSEEQSVMRTNLLGGLLEAAARNRARRVRSVHLFEIGAVFEPGPEPDAPPAEPRRLGLLMAGPLPERGWGMGERPADFFALKGVVEELAQALGLAVAFRASGHPSLHPGRQAEIVAGGQVVGLLGEVHPRVLEAFEAPARTCVAEIFLEPWVESFGATPRFRSLPRFPAVRRDLALLVPKAQTAAAVEGVIRRVGGPVLAELALFDVYEGQQVPEGYRSLAYALDFRSDERTLTDEEVNALIAQMETALEEELQVRIRR